MSSLRLAFTIFVLTKKILQLISGFSLRGTCDGELVYIGWSVSSPMSELVSTWFPIVRFLVAIIDDVIKVTQATYLCTRFSIGIAIYLRLLFNWIKIQYFYHDIERIWNESELWIDWIWTISEWVHSSRLSPEWILLGCENYIFNEANCIDFEAMYCAGYNETNHWSYSCDYQ